MKLFSFKVRGIVFTDTHPEILNMDMTISNIVANVADLTLKSITWSLRNIVIE